jgi:hypothetical protein
MFWLFPGAKRESPVRMVRFLCTALATLITAVALRAEPGSYFLPQDAARMDGVPSPAEFLGWDVGDWHVRAAETLAYFRELERASPRVKLEYYARSHEGKPLFHAVITSPENHARLEAIREEHLKLADPAQSAALDTSEMPAVVLLSYSIHGNEPSGANAALLVAWQLASSNDPETLDTLADTVVLLDPAQNPDGLDRFAGWANAHRSTRPSEDPADREHNEPWPRGRTNHYWFDLNRDWMPLVHPESRGRIAQFQRWLPNVVTDHHEMDTDNTFFFQPGIPTRENPSSPGVVAELTNLIGALHADALDRIGSLYYSREGFDDFYPGKGSTYPDINGGVGILFEQASSRGHAQRSDHGTVTFPFTIRNQVTTSFSTLRAVRGLRAKLLDHQREFFGTAVASAEKAGIAGWVVDGSEDPARAWHFLEMLRLHGIEVRSLAAEVKAGDRSFLPGSAWLVPAAQLKFRLAHEIFAERTEFKDNLFYDVSAWTVPLAYNLPFAQIAASALPSGAAGAALGEPFFPAGRVSGASDAYAYVFNWSGYYSPRALERLHRAGVLTKVATRAFEVETDEGRRAFPPGSVLVPLGPQADIRGTIEDVMSSIAREDAITVVAAGTGRAVTGPDLGSPGFKTVKPPVVALLTGDGVNPLEAGAAWHLLDTRVGLTPTLLEPSRINEAILARHNVVIMNDGTYAGISPAQVTALKDWLKAGGTLVAIGRAVEFVSKEEIARVEFVRATGEESKEPVAFGDGPRAESMKLIRGSIFSAQIDVTHPLFYGYARGTLPLMKNNRIFMKPSTTPFLDPAVYSAAPLLGGYISQENLAAIAGSSAVQVAHVGSGRVIFSSEDPNFRGMWLGGAKFFLNAIYLRELVKPMAAGGNYGEELSDH